MNRDQFVRLAGEYTEKNAGNYVPANQALSDSIKGMKMYEAPIFGFASAQDPFFRKLRDQHIVGKHHRMPLDWMREAKTVISFFAPFTEVVRNSNAEKMDWPSNEWLHARIEGQSFLNDLLRFLQKELEKQGHKTIVPSLSAEFSSKTAKQVYTSNWSERHIAYVCGLGTFSLSKGMITRKGVAGRFGSMVTEMPIEPTERDYDGCDDYCTHCGVCTRNCPAEAISMEKGKNHDLCCEFLDRIKKTCQPRYGCGKCQVGVPCETEIPTK